MSIFGRRQSDSRERSAQERERARLEREARRAAREGRPAPEPPPLADDDPFLGEDPFAPPTDEERRAVTRPTEEPEALDEIHVDSTSNGHEPGEHHFRLETPTVEWDTLGEQPTAPAGEPEFSAPAARAAAPSTRPAQRDEEQDTFAGWAAAEVEGEGEGDQPADPHEPQQEQPAAAPRSTRFGDEDERPLPPRRVNRSRTLPPPPPPPGTKGAKRRGRPRRGRLLGVFALVLIAGLGWLAWTVFQPFKGDGGDPVNVRVPEDSTANEVGDILAEKGIVDSAFVFTLRARLAGATLQAGTYQLPTDSSYGDTIDALETGPAPPKRIRLTIPEGRSRREAQPLVEQAGLEGSYLEASEKPTADFKPRRYGAPRNLRSLEGFLFPATYDLKPGVSSRRLVADQLDTFRSSIKDVSMRRARRRNLSTYDVLIIASMIEREAQVNRERRLISAVIHNRLREGMPLGIDATIRYATRNWSKPLKQSELRINSPYNTRRRTGLPPGPIGSPGLASIKAAANPANRDFLYYVVKPGTCGEHTFSSTDAKFQRDVAAYNRARERAGGKSPTTC